MTPEAFFENFDQFADAPNAVAKMRELVLMGDSPHRARPRIAGSLQREEV